MQTDFRFVGRLLGKALQQSVKLPKARLRPHLAKHLLNQPFSFADLAEVTQRRGAGYTPVIAE